MRGRLATLQNQHANIGVALASKFESIFNASTKVRAVAKMMLKLVRQAWLKNELRT